MVGKDTHFEVFLKKHKKASWTLVDARHGRQDALDLARDLAKQNPKGSIRVQRETWVAADSAFRSIVVFESGPERFEDPADKTAEASLPCRSPDDLFGPAARETVRRVLSGWLERRQVTPLELLSRPDLIEELDGSDTDLQHAIQKVAVARAQHSDASVHAYVRLLSDLVEKGVSQARRDAKSAAKPPRASGFADMAEQILAEGAPEKRLRRAIADSLSEARDFGAKTALLLDMHDDLPADPEARAFASKQADAFLAEFLTFENAVRSVIGPSADLGDEVRRLTGIYEGAPGSDDLARAPEVARRLAKKFKDRELPTAHDEIANRILAALRSPKRFKPDSVMAEIELSRGLAQRLIVASGPNLHPDALVEAFTHRSARILSPEAVDDALAGATDPADQIERLFKMETNIVGDQNKTKLAAYLRGKLKSTQTEGHFVRGPGQPFERLSRLAALQMRALKGHFPEGDKAELSAAFDDLGLKILDETKILSRVASPERPPLEQASALLKLAASGVLPLGRCRQDAQARAMRVLSSEAGRAEAVKPENRAALNDIQAALARLAA